MPCGTGKTLTCYLIAKKYKIIVLLSPLREFAKQNMDRFIEYGYQSSNALLVDTDGDRNIDNITEFINTNETLLISSTYKSMDVLCECLELFNKNDTLFVVDEFHNLSKANISDENNPIYKLLLSDHKVLFVSATPRIYDIEDEDYYNDNEMLIGNIVYKMTFQSAIENKYITDYKIWVPFVKENTTDLDKELSIYDIDTDVKNRCKFLFSALANNGSRKCIVYCKDTNDMKENIDAMIKMNEFYSLDIDINSISCEDSEKTRKKLLTDFSENNDNIQLLYSIKILNECIDIPSCDSIYISYATKNKITTIQRMCRALRTDPKNPFKIANIYLWCNEYDDILETLTAIKEYDCAIIDKIKLNVIDLYNDRDEKDISELEESVKEVHDYVIGIKEFKMVSWDEKLAMVKAYIIENGKLPSSECKDKSVRSMGYWISDQKKNYNKTVEIMKNANIRLKWDEFITEYSQLFKSNEERWIDSLCNLKIYIETCKKLPSTIDEQSDVRKLAKWMGHQRDNYRDITDIMKDDNIRLKWEKFIIENTEVFKSKQEIWEDKLSKVHNYIQKYKKLPSANKSKHTYNDIVLGGWISNQKQNYKNNWELMKDATIRLKWETFVNKNPQLFKTANEIWVDNLVSLKLYITTHNKSPTEHSKDPIIKALGNWKSIQKQNYKNKQNCLKDEQLRLKWDEFISENSIFFMTNEEIWNDNLIAVKNFINEHKRLPSRNDTNPSIKKIMLWITTQKQNYKNNKNIMKNQVIRQKWEVLIDEYSKLFNLT
jgi:superfamily II DNA or RNA helicase